MFSSRYTETSEFVSLTVLLVVAVMLGVVVPLLVSEPLGIVAFILPAVVFAGGIFLYQAAAGSDRAFAILLFLGVCMSELIFRKRAYSDKSIDFQIIIKLSLWAAMLIPPLVRMYTTKFASLAAIGPFWLSLYLWCLLSAVWSPVPLFTLVAAVSVLSYMLFFTYVLTVYDRFSVIRVIFFAFSAFCLASFLVYFAIPSLGRMPLYTTGDAIGAATTLTKRLTGLTPSANAMGVLSAFALLLGVMFFKELRRSDGYLFYLGFLIILTNMIMCQSRTAMISFFIFSYIFYFVRFRSVYVSAIAFAVLCFIIVIIMQNQDAFLRLMARSGSASEVTSLNGRAEIWPVAFAQFLEKPITGWGYASSAAVLLKLSSQVGFSSISHAHNLFLQILLTTGLVGFGLFIAAVGNFLFRCYMQNERVAATIFVFLMFNGLSDPGPLMGMPNVSVVALVIAVGLVAPVESRNGARSPTPAVEAAGTSRQELGAPAGAPEGQRA